MSLSLIGTSFDKDRKGKIIFLGKFFLVKGEDIGAGVGVAREARTGYSVRTQ
jgi:hypothetical protein